MIAVHRDVVLVIEIAAEAWLTNVAKATERRRKDVFTENFDPLDRKTINNQKQQIQH